MKEGTSSGDRDLGRRRRAGGSQPGRGERVGLLSWQGWRAIIDPVRRRHAHVLPRGRGRELLVGRLVARQDRGPMAGFLFSVSRSFFNWFRSREISVKRMF